MEVVQQDVNTSMRAILVDWLVEVSQEYKLVSETLFLAINYIDRFLSQGAAPRRKLQLVGITCMLIAAKYEEIYAPQIDEFCYITDNTYTREEMLAMEQQVHCDRLPCLLQHVLVYYCNMLPSSALLSHSSTGLLYLCPIRCYCRYWVHYHLS